MIALNLVEKQKEFFNTGKTRNIGFRIKSLIALEKAIIKNENNIYEALKSDLNKSFSESLITEVGIVKEEIRRAIANVEIWQRPKKVKMPISHFPATGKVYREPYGTALIISPWNYPFQLAMMPLIGAIAGGNCGVVKSSRKSPNTSKIIEKIIKEIFKEEYIAFAGNGISHDELLEAGFDIIFFTGNAKTGKHVMKKASKTITPVILELGGKSPCIVDQTADINLAARRIAWGKCVNAGQTCIAPDYVLADRKIAEELAIKIKKYMDAMYPNAITNKDYVQIINRENYNRIKGYITEARTVIGGGFDEERLTIEPTIILNAKESDMVMNEEIFGPILPIISYDRLKEATEYIVKRPVPLALYMFSRNKKAISSICKNVRFGGGCINDTLMHVANGNLPFGGAGTSGMGCYHGKYSFNAFTREKGVEHGKNFFDIPLRYPPYGRRKKNILKKIFKAGV